MSDFVERLRFLERHFHRQVEYIGERFACLTFRKVANWYCKVLRPGREAQQRLVRIESVAEFEGIVEGLRGKGPPRDWNNQLNEASIAVPSGSIEHW